MTEEHKAQMALRLNQMTGEPLAHCSYLLDQTNGDYETALKILERILQQRGSEPAAQISQDAGANTPDLETRVERLETQLQYLVGALDTMSNQLGLLLEKLSEADSKK